MSRELKDIKENIVKEMQINLDAKTTNTPYGKVSSDLKYILNKHKMKKGEIIAKIISKKTNEKKKEFVWLGLVEKSELNPIWLKYIIWYRPFISQHDKFNERYEQLFRNQKEKEDVGV